MLGNIPPNDGMPGGPIPPGFFQVCAGLGPCAGQVGGEAHRGKQLGLPWFKYSCFVLVEALHLISSTCRKAAEGKKEMGTCLPPGGLWQCPLPTPVWGEVSASGQCGAFFLTKGVFFVFPLLMSKPSFVSVLLPLSSSCLPFLSKLQTFGVTRKTRAPLPPAGLSILLLVNH